MLLLRRRRRRRHESKRVKHCIETRTRVRRSFCLDKMAGQPASKNTHDVDTRLGRKEGEE